MPILNPLSEVGYPIALRTSVEASCIAALIADPVVGVDGAFGVKTVEAFYRMVGGEDGTEREYTDDELPALTVEVFRAGRSKVATCRVAFAYGVRLRVKHDYAELITNRRDVADIVEAAAEILALKDGSATFLEEGYQVFVEEWDAAESSLLGSASPFYFDCPAQLSITVHYGQEAS